MKYTTNEVVEKLQQVNKNFNEAKLNAILETFFYVDNRPPINQKTIVMIREKYSIEISNNTILNEIKALECLGYKLPENKFNRTRKANVIKQVKKTSTSSIELIEAVYNNLVSKYRKPHHTLASKLSTEEKQVNYATVKRIEDKLIDLGVSAKEVFKVNGGKSGTKGKKFNTTVPLDEGIIRWNPINKLMPKAFAHLDGAW